MSPSGDGWFGRPILRPAKEPPLPQIQHPAGHPRDGDSRLSAKMWKFVSTPKRASGVVRPRPGGHIASAARLRESIGFSIARDHIIDWLIRKPGAFENYRYREELFPTTRFRLAYDQLRQHFTPRDRRVLARTGSPDSAVCGAPERRTAVNTVLGQLLRSGELPTLGAVEVLLQLSETPPLEDVHIDEVELTAYDHLLDGEEEVVQC